MNEEVNFYFLISISICQYVSVESQWSCDHYDLKRQKYFQGVSRQFAQFKISLENYNLELYNLVYW